MLANDSRNLLRQRTALAAPDSLTGLIDDADRCRFLGDIQSNIEGHRVAPMCVKAGRESPGSRNHRPPGPSAITGCPHMTRIRDQMAICVDAVTLHSSAQSLLS